MSHLKTFFVKYSNEARQIIHSDLETVEAFCNMHFGSAWDHAKEFGAHITMTEHDLGANLVDEKYHHMFHPPKEGEEAVAPAPPAPPPHPPKEGEEAVAPAPPAPPPHPVPHTPAPAQAPDPAQDAVSEPAPAPEAPAPDQAPTDPAAAAPSRAPDAPAGDVTVSLTGAESTTALGSPQS